MEQKKGQVTLFIIIAVLIVAAVLIFFLWVQPTFLSSQSAQVKLDKCIKDSIQKEAANLAETAGVSNPTNTILAGGKEVPYICYSETYYEKCVNQFPFLKETFENSLVANSREKIRSCYESALNNLERQGNTIKQASTDYELSITPGKIVVSMQGPVVSQGETAQTLLDSKVEVDIPVYEQTMFATAIVQSEQEYGDADMDSYNLLYPSFLTTKQKLSDGTTVYSIKDKKSEINYMFATRSWAYPAGYGN